jgi:hypothetical protein
VECCDDGHGVAPSKEELQVTVPLRACGHSAARARALAGPTRLLIGIVCAIAILLAASSEATSMNNAVLGRDVAGSAWFEMGSDYKRSSRFTAVQAVTVTDLVAYIDGLGSGAGSQQVRFAVYADGGGDPGALLAQSAVGTIADGAPAGWVRLALPAPLSLAPGAYHLAILSGATSRVARYSRDPVADGLRSGSDSFADGASSSYGNAAPDDYQIAIYALAQAPTVTAPLNLVPPVVSGAAVVGQGLTATDGEWTGSPTAYDFQWQRCDSGGANCASIVGETSSSYAIVSADAGRTIRVVVTATNSAGTAAAASAPTATIATTSVDDTAFGRQFAGTEWVSLTADYKRASRFTLHQAAVATSVVAYLDGNGPGYKDQDVRFAVYSDASGEPMTLLGQTIVGTVRAGAPGTWVELPLEAPAALAAGAYHLAIHSGSSSRGARYSREPMPDALRTSNDAFVDGSSALFGATGTGDYEIAIYAVLSGAVASSAPVNIAPPVIAGTARVGSTLAANTGTWSESPTRFAYQWQRCAVTGLTCSAIRGATAPTYQLTSTDEGSTIRVTVTATNEWGSTSAFSSPTAAVEAALAESTLSCDAYASPLGLDANVGTVAAPFRTVGKLIASMAAGGTGCLIGTQGAFPVENLTIGKTITLASVPGQWAVFQGSFYLNASANGTTLRDFKLDNTNSGYIALKLNADNVTVSNLEITNNNKPNGSSNYNGICVLAGPGFENGDAYIVSNLLVENSSIHNCGDDSHEHSLYLEGTRNPIIRDNYLYGNYGLGLDLYPDTQGMIAEYNVIYGNSRGGKENVGLAGEIAGGEYKYDHASSNNTVRYNIITNAVQRYNVDSYYPSSKVLPTGNTVTNNCVWNAPYGNYGYDRGTGDYTQTNNKDTDPLYLNPAAADFRLQPGSPCTGWGPRTTPASIN